MKVGEGLNEKQLEAMKSEAEAVRIIAGPGTGKTKTLVERIGYLTSVKGVEASKIGAITYTRKAARELRSRLYKKMGGGARSIWVGTIHGLGKEILGEVEVIDERRRRWMVRKMIDEGEWKNLKKRPIREVAEEIARKKMGGEREGKWGEIIDEYERRLKEKAVVDYDDLIIKAKGVAQERFLHLLVDEFQDVGEGEYELIKRVGRNLWVIGDPRQSIYGFKGAGGAFEKLERDYVGIETVVLEMNYRSGRKIVEVMERLFEPRVKAVNEGGEVWLREVLDGGMEADVVVEMIEEKMGGMDMLDASEVWGKEDRRIDFSDFGVIYRTHGMARVVRRKLLQKGIPYQMVGDESVFEKRGIREVVRCLIYFVSKEEEEIEEMMADDWISEKQAKEIMSMKVEDMEVRSIIDTLKEKLEVETKMGKEGEMDMQCFEQEVRGFIEEGRNLDEVVKYILELEENGYYDARANKVCLVTMHGSKGLEFEYVFLLGVEEGIIPMTKKDTDVDEERRLFYVAMSRAKKELNLLKARQRGGSEREGSRFLRQIGGEGLKKVGDRRIETAINRRRKRALKKAQMGLF